MNWLNFRSFIAHLPYLLVYVQISPIIVPEQGSFLLQIQVRLLK